MVSNEKMGNYFRFGFIFVMFAFVTYLVVGKKHKLKKTVLEIPEGVNDDKANSYISDAKALYKALGFDYVLGLSLPNWMNDDEKVLNILSDYETYQFDNLKKVYNEEFERDLVKDLVSRLSEKEISSLSKIL